MNLFDSSKTVYNDHSNRSFVYRQDKAREDVETKKKRLIPDLSKNLKTSRINLNRSMSMTDKFSNKSKQTLHDQLHSIKYDDTE